MINMETDKILELQFALLFASSTVKMSDPNKCGKDHSFEFLAMPYDDFDVLVNDINEHKLEEIGKDREIEHLSTGTFPTPAFPVEGIVHGRNIRYMVPLVVQRHKKPNSKAVNVWFLVDSGSPFTCITVKTLEAFFGAGNVVGQAVERDKCTKCGKPISEEDNLINDKVYTMAIQYQRIGIECKVSKGHFKEVNILGADAMRKLKLSIDADWETETFKLIKK